MSTSVSGHPSTVGWERYARMREFLALALALAAALAVALVIVAVTAGDSTSSDPSSRTSQPAAVTTCSVAGPRAVVRDASCNPTREFGN